jgi:hypothetical protein
MTCIDLAPAHSALQHIHSAFKLRRPCCVCTVVQYLTNALRSGSINANTLLRGESLQNEAWLQETFK